MKIRSFTVTDYIPLNAVKLKNVRGAVQKRTIGKASHPYIQELERQEKMGINDDCHGKLDG
ncbi:hypothetical protein P4T04_08410 [Bacillus badius]|uniref:hypothetical protein n=1 Tax=Bacillus badius TaxID=1455 RepID=UPI000A5EEA89|nr:hypothetical protein [Bacillus badius]MED0666331.1 hypothetical protein [Bacillus badius]OVE53093.1 hypothetical protein B1A98_05790 [Bacillus badius]